MMVPSRLQRISNGHCQNSHQGAVGATEKKINSALPIRFSSGTKPTPAGCRSGENRLSRLLSRLSPIANTDASGTLYSGVLLGSRSLDGSGVNGNETVSSDGSRFSIV